MRVRTFALLMLVTFSVAPLLGFGYVAITRWEQTARSEVAEGQVRLAQTVAERIEAYLESSHSKLRVIGQAVLQAADPELALNAFSIEFQTFHDMAVYRDRGDRLAGEPPAGGDGATARERAIAGQSWSSGVLPADPERAGPFANTMVLGEPVSVAGHEEGAIVALLDLIELWRPVNSIRIGQTGFVRLVAKDGTTLAHGNPANRREVFSHDAHSDGDTMVSKAAVPGTGWSVIVEQSAGEALASVRSTRRHLLWLGGITLILACVIAVFVGRRFVRGLEALGAHTERLAGGDLSARARVGGELAEINALAAAINDMAGSLQELQAEAARRERLATFARVAAGLTHDLRQPIETIRAACTRLATDPEDEDAWELFRWTCDNELPRLTRFVHDLRGLAGTGDMAVETERVDIAELFDSLCDDLRAAPKWQGIEFESAATNAVVDADRNLLRRALYNLAANAADACATRKQGGRVKLSAEPGDGAVRLCVDDDGVGMSEQVLERILSGDFQSTKRSTGIGLGLGVVFHVVQRHGGSVDVSSVPEQGSRFAIELPRSAQTLDANLD